MARGETRYLGHVVLAGLAAALLVFGMRLGRRDVEFCRSVLTGLARGNPSVQRAIDWERLQAIGVDVGTTYAAYSDQERRDYQQAFLGQFSTAFQGAGGNVKAFRNWRVHRRTRRHVVVAADHPAQGSTLLFWVSRGWRQRLEAIRWEDAEGTQI